MHITGNNFSSDSNEDSTIDYAPSDIAFFVYYYGGLLALSAIGIVGNSMVIVGITRHRSLRTPNNYFIFSLALSDLLLAILYPIYDVTHLDGDYANELLGNYSLFCTQFFNLPIVPRSRNA